MKAVLEELQLAETGRKRLIGRLIFVALLLLAAAVGVVGGLLLVYSTDLPQVEALEHYRPISSSERLSARLRCSGAWCPLTTISRRC